MSSLRKLKYFEEDIQMKKLLKTIVIGVVALVLLAIGCGSSGSDEVKEVVTSNSQTTEGEGESAEDGQSTELKQTQEVTIEEQILFEQNGIIITAKEFVTDSIWGDGISLLIENNSDKTVGIGCDALIVNNYMISDLFFAEVAAGKKANEVMYLSSSGLRAAGIESVGQVEVYFYGYESDTYDTIFKTDCITIQTSEYANMDVSPDDAGSELYNKDGIRIVGKTVDENSFWGTAILLYCENNSGKNVGISVEEMSINGFMMNPLFTSTIYDGKKSISDITIFSSELEENGIESIEEVELKFHIYNADSYDTIDNSEAITFGAE